MGREGKDGVGVAHCLVYSPLFPNDAFLRKKKDGGGRGEREEGTKGNDAYDVDSKKW